MTSAADFTRQKQTVDVDEKPRWKMPKITWLDFCAYAPLALMAGVAMFFSAWFFQLTDCDVRGLVAGAESWSDVHFSLAFRCVAKVDGKWIEVK